MARNIDYYFAIYSPWSYIGHKPFIEIATRHRLPITYKPTPLLEVFAETGGVPLAQRPPARQSYRWVELQRWRDKRGLSLNLKPKFWPYKSTLADRCVIAVQQTEHDPDTFLTLAYKAVWSKDLNLDDESLVASLLSASGLDPGRIIHLANSEAVQARYRQNKDDAVAAGVFGAPSYVIEGEIFWGQDRLDLLSDMLASGRKPYRPL
ncbi:MAG TPA: 2-hydroxychromene-2-carboxylate isomerase [Beijerinckiaceae bacterium]|nr:2-hydroxychromene-2-carboxylate isomerase [Beijerinckiaceae bacterium]